MPPTKKTRSMRRILTVTVGIGLVIFGGIFFLLFYTAMPMLLRQAETKYASEQANLVGGLLDSAVESTFRLTYDFCSWDEAALYAMGKNDGFIKENWTEMPPTEAYRFNYLVIKNSDSRDVYVEFFDFFNGKLMPAPDGFTDYLTGIADAVVKKSPMETDNPYERGIGGIFFYDETPYLSVTLPVAVGNDFSSTSGTVTYGIILSDDYFKDLTMYETAEFHFISGHHENRQYTPGGNNSVFSLISLEDIWGNPISLVITDSRTIYAEGMRTANIAMLVFTVVILLFALCLFVIFRKAVVRPLEALIEDVDSVSAGEEINVRDYSSSELASLGGSINDMLARLDNAQVSEDSLRHILNGLEVFLYVSDVNTDELLFINDRLVEHFKVSPDSIGKKCWEVFRPGSVGHCDDCTLKYIINAPDSIYTWERKSHFNGRHYRHTDCFIDWVGGRRAHLQGMIDITDSVEAEAKLQRQLELQELMSDISGSFISEENTQALLSRALSRVGEFMGIDRVVIASVSPEGDALGFFAGWKSMRESSTALQPRTFPFKPGNVFYDSFIERGLGYIESGELDGEYDLSYMGEFGTNSFLSFPIMVEGRVWGILTLGDHVSHHSWSDSDRQLALLFASLTSGVVSRDASRRELVAAKEQAEESSRAKGDFLSRMSHEMRTPMNAIIGMTTIAKSSNDPEKKEYCLDKIGEASAHLLGVINDILDMSKIEASKFELNYAEMHLEKMLQRVVNVLNFRVEEKNQSLIVTIDPRLPPRIISDEQRLSQVITNLLSNAVKFTPDGGTVSLAVTLLGIRDTLCDIQVDVADTGIGITAEQMEKLFRPFEQADGGISRRFGGTGLGLVISKSIIDLMGGEIWAVSEAANGSTFSFRISAERTVRNAGTIWGDNIGWGELSVLVVDDKKEELDYFRKLAQHISLKCDIADSARAALDRLVDSEAPYHIIFTSWLMPDMNGIELAREIKRLGTPCVVLMTSPAKWDEVAEAALDAGVDLYLSTPLFPSAIVNCINECLGLAGIPEQSEDTGETPHFPGRRILLAEDVEINREIMYSLLEGTGIEIDCAVNGAEAVEMFRRSPSRYDMILMDIHMPDMDGYEATIRIRCSDLNGSAEIPIVAMTANVFREDVEKCLASGMNDHIGKPIDVQSLYDKLRKYLSRS